MDFLERDLEDIIYNTNQEDIRDRGLFCYVYDSIFRQVPLGNYGITDIITFKSFGKNRKVITVYELKNKILNEKAFWQLVRYMKAIEHFVRIYDICDRPIIRGVLIGRYIDKSGEFCYLPTIHSNIEIFTYDYEFDGISFGHLNDRYSLINPGEVKPDFFGAISGFDFYRILLGKSKSPVETGQ